MGDVWTVTIDDASSIINWHPQGDGGVGNWTQTGWQPWYSTSGGFTTRGGEAAMGSSKHITGFPNASLDFLFYGTAVSLYGEANCSYSVSIDGAPLESFKPKQGQLYSKGNLTQETHNISLVAHASNSKMLTFEHADVTRTVATGASTPSPKVYQATNTSIIDYAGNWTLRHDPLIPSFDRPAPYYGIDNPPASLSFSFQGVGVALNGSRNWGSWTYNVNLDGNTTTYNASTMWFIGDALLYYQDGLDPRENHTLNVTATVGAGLKFWLNTVTVFVDSADQAGALVGNTSTTGSPPQATSSTPHDHKTNAGVIIGPVIGGVVALALLAAVLLWYVRRNRLRTAERAMIEHPSPFIVGARPPPPVQSPTGDIPRDTKSATVFAHGTSHSAARMGVPSLPHSPSTQSESSQNLSDTPLLRASPSSPGTQPTSPAQSSPAGTDPNAAVERILQILAERVAPQPPRSEYAPEAPPPEYGA